MWLAAVPSSAAFDTATSVLPVLAAGSFAPILRLLFAERWKLPDASETVPIDFNKIYPDREHLVKGSVQLTSLFR